MTRGAAPPQTWTVPGPRYCTSTAVLAAIARQRPVRNYSRFLLHYATAYCNIEMYDNGKKWNTCWIWLFYWSVQKWHNLPKSGPKRSNSRGPTLREVHNNKYNRRPSRANIKLSNIFDSEYLPVLGSRSNRNLSFTDPSSGTGTNRRLLRTCQAASALAMLVLRISWRVAFAKYYPLFSLR